MQGCTLEVAALATNFGWFLNTLRLRPFEYQTWTISSFLFHTNQLQYHIPTHNLNIEHGVSHNLDATKNIDSNLERNFIERPFFIKTYNAKISYGVKCPVCTYEDCKWLPSWILLGLIATESSAPLKLKLTFFWKLIFE